MSFKKTVAIATAAGALAAISVPAMAFENEFHGSFTSRFILSSYDNGGATTLNPSLYKENNTANNYIEQRARLQYIAKASDDLKLVTHFELDTKFGGDKTGKYAGTSDGGVLDADGVSIETKHIYLDFNLGKSVNVKTGIMPIKDAFKGIFMDVDATGIAVTTKMAPLTVKTSYFRVATETNATAAGAVTAIGHNNKDVFLLDTTFAATDKINVGASYYLLADYQTSAATTVHLVGVNADAKVGPATVSGFVAAETGYATVAAGKKSVSGYAANLAAKMPVGPGTLRTAGLFLSGDDKTNNHDTAFANVGGATYGESNLWILARTGAGGTSSDRTIPGVSGPGAKGQWLYTLGYDATITPKIFANANLGLSWVAKNSTNNNSFQGTELNAETGYKIYDNMTAKVQVAYAILGGYYEGTSAGAKDPENPYSVRVAWNYAF